MFIAVLSLTATKWKEHRCPSADVRINKIWYIHQMEYYLSIKTNRVLIYAIIWVNLENMVSERSQQQRPPTARFHLHTLSRRGKYRDRKQITRN